MKTHRQLYLVLSLSLALPLYVATAKPADKGDKGASAKTPKEAPKNANRNAGALLKSMKAAVVATGNAAKAADAKVLDPKQKRDKVFFTALKGVNEGVDKMTKAVETKDKGLFKLMDQTGRSVAQLNDSVRLLRIQDKKLTQPIKALSMSFNELDTNYGPLAVRKKQGGAPTADELAKASKLQANMKTMHASLKPIYEKAKASKNARLVSEIDELMADTNRAAKIQAAASLTAYLDLLSTLAIVESQWWAFGEVTQVWYPDVYVVWESSNTSFNPYFQSYSLTMDSITVSDWSYLESSVSVVDSTELYSVNVAESDLASGSAAIESYDEASATVEVTAEETRADQQDTKTYDDSTYEAGDDKDGDGLTDADDDDGDGVSDAQNSDDDRDGIADEKEHGDNDGDKDDGDKDDKERAAYHDDGGDGGDGGGDHGGGDHGGGDHGGGDGGGDGDDGE